MARIRQLAPVWCTLFCILLTLSAAPRAFAEAQLFSLTPLPRDKLVFDVSAVDRAVAVPLSGQAPKGAVIEGRIGPNGIWQEIAIADDAGLWSGTLGPLQAADGFVSPQVRLGDKVLTATEVAAGRIVTIWGQSEFHRSVLPQHAALETVPVIRDPEALQVTYSLSATEGYGTAQAMRHHMVTNAMPVSTHMAHLSNLLSRVAPGVRWHLVFHTAAGTGFQQLLSDERKGREWSDDLALARFAFPVGQQPGLNWMSWYASDAGLAERYAPVLRAALTGADAEGYPITRGQLPSYGTQRLDHFLADLYGAKTPWVIAGPHRFELPNLAAQIAASRASVDALFEEPDLPGHIRRGLEPLTYLNGNPSWGGDYGHPDTSVRPMDGMVRLILLMGHSILRQTGFSDWDLPALDRAELSEDGTTLTVWSSAGPVSTTRMARAGLTEGFVHGFRLNNTPMRTARIENGRIVVRADADGAPFDVGARVTFGAGGIGAVQLERDVRRREIWQDYPIVDMGQTDLEGIPVKAQSKVLDILPKAADPSELALEDNLLPQSVARMEPGRDGWRSDSEGWRFNTLTETATASALTRRAVMARASFEEMLVPTRLSFAATQTGSDPERVRVRVLATGRDRVLLADQEMTIRPNHRQFVDVDAAPSGTRQLLITIARRGEPTGDLTVGSVTLRAR